MPVHAHILGHAVPGRALEAVELVRRIPEVKLAATVTEPHDDIAPVEVPDVPQLGVTNKIQKATGVVSTLISAVVC